MKDFSAFQKEILSMSESDIWFFAKAEWLFDHAYFDKGYCICGQPIVEHCVIRNTKTDATAVVGNECVKMFGGAKGMPDTAKLFQAMHKLAKNGLEVNPGKYTLSASLSQGWITSSEFEFMNKMFRMKWPKYDNEKAQIIRINRKIIKAFMGI